MSGTVTPGDASGRSDEESRRETRRSRLHEANPTVEIEESRRETRRSRLHEANPTVEVARK
jgi:hypothetical protein